MGPCCCCCRISRWFVKINCDELAVRNPKIHPAGFEPALPKETELKSVALDHSAKDAWFFVVETHWFS